MKSRLEAMRRLRSENEALRTQVADLTALLNTPENADFIKGVTVEIPHQRLRWGDQHDAAKTGEDWVFLFGYLAGKAVQAKKCGEIHKAQHHAITAAAAMANFHRLASVANEHETK